MARKKFDSPQSFRDGLVRRLKAIKSELGKKTDAEMAEFLGIGRGTWYNWEHAENRPDPWHMARLCAATKDRIDLDYIYRGIFTSVETGLAIRLMAREIGLDPDAEDFLDMREAVALKVSARV